MKDSAKENLFRLNSCQSLDVAPGLAEPGIGWLVGDFRPYGALAVGSEPARSSIASGMDS